MKGVMGKAVGLAAAENKANFRPYADPEIGVPGEEANRAKQSQLSPGVRNGARIGGLGAPRRCLIVRNKANSRLAGRPEGPGNRHHILPTYPTPSDFEEKVATEGVEA